MIAYPEFSFVVLTREGSGCLWEQRVLRDVTGLLGGTESKAVTLEQLEPVEDRLDQVELFLFFRAAPILSRKGFLAFRLAAARREGNQPAHFSATQARFVVGEESNTAHLELEGKIQGLLQAEMLFVPELVFKRGRFTCPEADLFVPADVQFLPGYPLSLSIDTAAKGVRGTNDQFLLSLNDPSWRRQALLVADCAELLAALDRQLSASTEYAFLWDRRKMTPQSLDRAAQSLEGEGSRKFFLACRLHGPGGPEQIARPGDQSVPVLRQRIAAMDPSGHLTGGEIWIGLERDAQLP